jgi:histidinol-phosphate aminotransferase
MTTFEKIANPWIAGQRPYQPGRPLEEVARELGKADIAGIVKLASNENALGPSPKAMAAMRECIGQMHLYPDGGAFYLRQAIARHYGISPDMTMLGCGCNEHAVLLAHAFMAEGDDLVVSERSFVVYQLVASLYRCGTVRVPMRDGATTDLEGMLAAIGPRTKLVVIGNPNNPTGTIVGQEAIDAYMERVPDHVVTVFDEAYMELLDPEEQLDTIKHVKAGKKPVVTLRTFSKAYGLAGLRIGYAIAQPECIGLLNKVRQPFNVNAMAQRAAIAALEDTQHLEATRAMLRAGRKQMLDGLRALGLDPQPTKTNFIFVPFKRAGELAKAMERRDVIIRPLAGFGLPEHVRIGVGTEAENRQCLAALKGALEELG